MLDIIVLGLICSPILFIILFIICALKISSMCSRIEELEEAQRIIKESDDNELCITRV